MNVYVLQEGYDTDFGPHADVVHSVYETEEQALEAMEALVTEYLGHLQCTKTVQEGGDRHFYVKALDGSRAGKDVMTRYQHGVKFHEHMAVEHHPGYPTDVVGYSVEEFVVNTTPVRGHAVSSVAPPYDIEAMDAALLDVGTKHAPTMDYDPETGLPYDEA